MIRRSLSIDFELLHASDVANNPGTTKDHKSSEETTSLMKALLIHVPNVTYMYVDTHYITGQCNP